MVSYEFNSMGDEQFEEMIQSLLKKVIGNGTTTFGKGRDGAREATFTGRTNYPNETNPWDGCWIFQVKFHDTRQMSAEKAKKSILADLKSELDKIIQYYGHLDNYIMATNIKLTGGRSVGTHDLIQEVADTYSEFIKNVHVWGYDDVCRFLDNNADVCAAYLHLITPGHIMYQIVSGLSKKEDLTEIILLFATTSFNKEKFVQLDQAGEVGETQIFLPKVFVDLDVEPPLDYVGADAELDDFIISASAKLIRKEELKRSIIIGGPGQGKSTLCQFIAQIHRSYLLQRDDDAALKGGNYLPFPIRIPFRIILKDYAQWISNQERPITFEDYMSNMIADLTSRKLENEDLHRLFKENPILLILDGIDEVSDLVLLKTTITSIKDFVFRADALKSDLQIIATSRPTGYDDQFAEFTKLKIMDFSVTKIEEYVEKWIVVKDLSKDKSDSLRSTLKECLRYSHFRSLMNTPLQVTIFILIILSGGTPPQQREELFNEYLEIIYKREASKSTQIIRSQKTLLLGLHQYLGYILHRKAATSSETQSKMNSEEFKNHVGTFLKIHDQFLTQDELENKIAQVIKEARQRLVLIVELEPGYFGFELRSLQEFFAAAYLVDSKKDDLQLIERFKTISRSSHWRNVALFFAGRIGRLHSGSAAYILEVCREIDRYPPGLFTRQGSILASELAVDRSFGISINESLERSAIEIALEANDYLDSYGRDDIINTLEHIQEGDIDKHLLPVIETKPTSTSTRIRLLPKILNNFERYGEIISQLRIAYEKKEIDCNIFFRKLILYQVPANFIFSEKDILNTVDMKTAVEVLLPLVRRNAKYLFEIIPLLESHNSLGDQIFKEVLEKGLGHLREIPTAVEFGFSDISEQTRNYQMVLAAYLSTLPLNPRRLPDVFNTIIDVDSYPFILETISNVKVALELRVILYVIISKLVALNYISNEKIKEFDSRNDLLFRIFKKNKSSYRSVEKILLFMRYPSVETTLTLEKKKYKDFQGDKKLIRIIQHYNWILDCLGIEETRKIINSTMGIQLDRRTIALFKQQVRKSRYGIFSKVEDLDLKFVSKVLSIASSLLKDIDSDDWKPYTILRLLASYKWSNSNNDHEYNLSRSLSKIIGQLSKIGKHHRNVIQILMISQLARLNKHENHIRQLFYGLGIDKGHIDSPSRFLVDVDIKTARWLVKESVRYDDGALRGFFKWFYFYQTAKRLRRNARKDSDRLNLDLDISRIKIIFGHLDRLDSSGALYFVSQASSVDINDLKFFIESSKKIKSTYIIPWGEILSEIIQKMDRDNSIKYLVDMLIDQTYPTGIRNVALKRYESFTSETGTEIIQREKDLGLPFQSETSLYK